MQADPIEKKSIKEDSTLLCYISLFSGQLTIKKILRSNISALTYLSSMYKASFKHEVYPYLKKNGDNHKNQIPNE